MSRDALDALLAAEIKDEKDVYIKRLDAYFTVRSLTGEEIAQITDEASSWVGKGAKRRRETDETKFGALVIAKACINPNFADKRLLEKYGAVSVEEVVMKALRPGEIVKISNEVMELCGFDDDEDEAVEEVKNS